MSTIAAVPNQTTNITPGSSARVAALVGPCVTVGVATTVAMWIVWWITHLPAVSAAAPVTLVTLIATNLLILTWQSSKAGRPAAVWVGLGGAAVAATLNLLILGSLLGEQAETTSEMASAANTFRSEAPLIVMSFFGASAVCGVIAGLAGRALGGASERLEPRRWLARYATILAIGFVPLLAVGGSVTSTESGMAVPDAVTSYDAVSFLFPISLMAEPRIFLEHTHRLFGTLIGAAAILLVFQTFFTRAPMRYRVMSIVLLALVIVQGLLGIARVSEIVRGWPGLSAIPEAYWATLHGIKGQGVFAFAVWTAAAISGSATITESSLPGRTMTFARRAKTIGGFAIVALAIQLVFGALSRHTGAPHALWSHVGWSVVVAMTVFIVAVLLASADQLSETGSKLRTLGKSIMVVVSLQIALGFAALLAVGNSGSDRPIPTADELATAAPIAAGEAFATTFHQTLGAVLLGLVVLATVRAAQVSKIANDTAQTPAEAG
ncbi:MAG: COX15/CtaA family protein [Planctomycetota bacterium]